MSLDPFLLEVLCDPVDGGELYYVASANILYNPRLKVAYEVKGAIPVLLPDEGRSVSDVEHDAIIVAQEIQVTGTKQT